MNKKFLYGAVLAAFLVGCNDEESKGTNSSGQDAQVAEATQTTEETATYPNAQLLADAAWTQENLEDENLVIIDARTEGYDAGHIPGAILLSTAQLNDINNEVDGFLLGEEEFTTLAQSIGLNEDSTVLVYDEGNSLSATRVFFALEYYGLKDKVKVLNGGYAGWLVAGSEVQTDAVQPEAGNFVAKANDNLVSTREEVEELLGSEDVVILDTRSDDEFTGKDLRKNENGGHIPGAVHNEWSNAIAENEEGVPVFLGNEDLTANFAASGVEEGKTVIPYCQTNVRGAHTYFALRLLGYDDVRPYEGSWAEWGNAGDTDIEG